MLDWSIFLSGLGWALLAQAVLFGVTFAIAVRTHRHSVVDVTWGLGFAAIAVVTTLAAYGEGEDSLRTLSAVLTTVWGVRLGAHIWNRNRGAGEDPRYEALMAKAPGNPHLHAFTRVYLTQAAVMFFVSLPVQAAAATSSGLGWVVWLGVVVWAIGMFFETVGDWQLHRFRQERDSKDQVLDSGLWRYTRHPNYFGDACVWWGLFLVAAGGSPWAWVFVLSPVAMTANLAKGTGAALLEKDIAERRPAYADYVRRTSGFVPRPPKRSAD